MKIINITYSGSCSKAVFAQVEYRNLWGTTKYREVSLGISIFRDKSISYGSLLFTDNDENIFSNEGLQLMIIREHENHLQSLRKDTKMSLDEINLIRDMIATEVNQLGLELINPKIGFGEERTFAEQRRQQLNRLMDKLTKLL